LYDYLEFGDIGAEILDLFLVELGGALGVLICTVSGSVFVWGWVELVYPAGRLVRGAEVGK